jgi:hypothetical protein
MRLIVDVIACWTDMQEQGIYQHKSSSFLTKALSKSLEWDMVVYPSHLEGEDYWR